jgi:hypothetical protein
MSRLILALFLAAALASAEERSEWKPLWDGKTLEGWVAFGGGDWRIVRNAIAGSLVGTERRHGVLMSEKSYADFALRLQFRVTRGNSGVYFRARRTPQHVGMRGLQAEIDGMNTGGLFDVGGRGWVAKADRDNVIDVLKPKGWNQLAITCREGEVLVRVNGRVTAHFHDELGPREGHIAFHLHGSRDALIEFKDIDIIAYNLPRGE